jgi:hypothetical protein
MPEEKKEESFVVIKFGRPVTDDDLEKLRAHEDVVEVARTGVLGWRPPGILDYTLRLDEF